MSLVSHAPSGGSRGGRAVVEINTNCVIFAVLCRVLGESVWLVGLLSSWPHNNGEMKTTDSDVVN